jgi:hypothetical protein
MTAQPRNAQDDPIGVLQLMISLATFPRTAEATCAPHHGQQSREVIALSATGQFGVAAPGQIQLTVVTAPMKRRGNLTD